MEMCEKVENLSTKVQIAPLQGKSNWDTWKYKISILLRSIPDALDIVEGRCMRPVLPAGVGDAEVTAFRTKLARFIQAENNAMILLSTNLNEDTVRKVMSFSCPREVWLELHRLFDGDNENRAYNLCLDFFGFKLDASDDMATHICKLKTLWCQLNREIGKDNPNMRLPEIFLICKILYTLDQKYFEFKSSWLLLAKEQRTVEGLTSNLCAHEKSLLKKNCESSEEVLVTSTTQNSTIRKEKKNKDKHMRCNYCHEMGHRVRSCQKWMKDGRPPKDSNNKPSSSQSANMAIMSVNVMSFVGQDKESWYVDNGATSHVTNRSDLFQTFQQFDEIQGVTTANGNIVQARGKGTIYLEADVKGKIVNIALTDVWYVPEIQRSLYSVLAMHDKQKNSKFVSTPETCEVFLNGVLAVVGKRNQCGGLFKLKVRNILPPVPVLATTTTDLMQLYHERLAHQNKRHVKEVIQRELGLTLPLNKELCESCIYGKMHRLKFGIRERSTQPGEIIHSDVCGPFPMSFSKYRYYVLFKDDFSGYCMVYCMRNKNEVKDKLSIMLQESMVTGHVIKTLLSDNGTEFDNKEVRDILNKKGIKQRLVMPYTPEQNGCSERQNRTLVETVRTLMNAQRELPKALWAELIMTAAYILNRTGATREKDKSPYELWFGKKPNIKHLRIIGSTCYAHVPKIKRKKLDRKATKGILIGYDNDDGYRIWYETQHKVDNLIRSRDVIFEETPIPGIEAKASGIVAKSDPKPTEKEWTVSFDTVPENTSRQHLQIDNPLNQEAQSEQRSVLLEGELEEDRHLRTPIETSIEANESRDQGQSVQLEGEREIEYIEDEIAFSDNEIEEEFVDAVPVHIEIEENLEGDVSLSDVPRYNLRDRSTLQPPRKLDDYSLFLVDTEKEPSTYKEAISSETNKDRWLQAMRSEFDSLQRLQVWDLQNLPSNRKALPCKWIYKVKTNPDGTIKKYKARLVVKGFKQKKGFDYNETFSPVARLTTIRSLLSVAARERLHLIQFDVATAFLNGNLTEEIYMEQPEGFKDGTSRVCRLKKSLYGLKQAPRCWNYCFAEILESLGFKTSDADPCLYTKILGDKKILIALYVDDGLVAASDENLAKSFIMDLKKILTITSKPVSYYLGLEIEKMKDGSLFIKQEAYANKVLERFNMKDCNPVSTPLQKEGTIEKGKADKESQSFPYREAVGSLAYLMVGTRPDLAYAVGLASRSLEKPTSSDWRMVKHIMRYLKGTLSRGIMYVHDANSPNQIKAYSDADHAGCLKTGRSTTGVLCLFSRGAISWTSQRQHSVAISTTEAELVAASEAARELIWLKRLFKNLNGQKEVPVLFVDNEAAVKLAHNPEFHRRTKHIRVRHFFVRELVLQNDIVVERTSSATQLADLLTKALPRPRLLELVQKLGLMDKPNGRQSAEGKY